MGYPAAVKGNEDAFQVLIEINLRYVKWKSKIQHREEYCEKREQRIHNVLLSINSLWRETHSLEIGGWV